MITLFLLLLVFFAVIKSFREEAFNFNRSPQRNDPQALPVQHAPIKNHQKNALKAQYPELTVAETAAMRYRELRRKRELGLINDADYEIELSCILPLINILEDVKSYN